MIGTGKETEGHEERHRVAGAAEEGRPADPAEGDRLAGADGDVPEIQRAEPLDRRLEMVLLAHRDPAAGDDQIRRRARRGVRAAMVASRVSATMPRSTTSQPRPCSSPLRVKRLEL